MRPTTRWYRRASDRYAPQASQRGVVHLRNYSSEFVVVGDGEPIVLIPGLAGGYELTGRLVRRLAQRYRVICFQLRGERDPIQARLPFTLVDLADDLREFLDALLLEQPTLVGVSFGSAVALEFALRHRGRIGALVVQGTEGHFRHSLIGRMAHLVLAHYPLPHDNPFFNQFFRVLFARRESVGRLFDYVASRCWRTDQSVIVHRLALLADFDVRDRVKDLDVPTLVIAGQDDAVIRPAGQKSLAASIPLARYVSLPDSGHLCFLTRPKMFARRVAEFLTCQLDAAKT